MLWVSPQVPSTATLAPPSDSLLAPTTWKLSAGRLLGSQPCGPTLPQRLRPTAGLGWQCQATLQKATPYEAIPSNWKPASSQWRHLPENMCTAFRQEGKVCVGTSVYILQPTLKYISKPSISTQLVDCGLLLYVR